MSKVIGSQNEKWGIIENGIDSLEQFSNALPQEIKKYINKQVLDIEEIRKITSELKNEKFTISVCGVVKAGKSTFINSYLFGKEIFPEITFESQYGKLTFSQVIIPDFSKNEKAFDYLKKIS